VQKQIVRNPSGSALGVRMSPARSHLGKNSDKTSSGKTSSGRTTNNRSNGTSIKTPDLTGRRIRNIALKHDRMPPINQNDTGDFDLANSSYKADLAFQRAMHSAIACGLERPPLIGVARDLRPLRAPRLFEPVPHSSGCTSPAFECAELAAHKEVSRKD
jgi:hypothetical protein